MSNTTTRGAVLGCWEGNEGRPNQLTQSTKVDQEEYSVPI